MSLTDDEMSVLMIADRDQYMLAIGRWELPVKSLTNKGLPRREMINGGPQYTITEQGRVALHVQERAIDDRVTQAIVQTNNATFEARQYAEQAAQMLAKAAKISNSVTGEHPVTAAHRWTPEILARALELLHG